MSSICELIYYLLPVLSVNVSLLHVSTSMVLNVTKYDFSPTNMNTIYVPKLSSMSCVLLKRSNGNIVNIGCIALIGCFSYWNVSCLYAEVFIVKCRNDYSLMIVQITSSS